MTTKKSYLRIPIFWAATAWFSLTSSWCSWNRIEILWFMIRYFCRQLVTQLSSTLVTFLDEKSSTQSLKQISAILLYCLINSLICFDFQDFIYTVIYTHIISIEFIIYIVYYYHTAGIVSSKLGPSWDCCCFCISNQKFFK